VPLIVLVVGLVITLALVLVAWALNDHNQSRLLGLEAKQAGTVIAAAVPGTQTPLEVATQVARTSGGATSAFEQYMTTQVGPGKQFTAASLWRGTGAGARPLASVGSSELLTTRSVEARDLVARSFGSSTFVVSEFQDGRQLSLGFALATPGSGPRFAVYAERPLPADRKAAVAQNSAFSDLSYAIYLGGTTTPSHLLTTDFDRLPVSGRHATVREPFGDSQLTLVVAAQSQLTGTLSSWLPWIFAVMGIVLSVSAALITERLVRRRHAAESAETQIRRLYDELGTLYGRQRTIAETLQRTLLPRASPDIPGLEIAVRYLPGAHGIDIGGDWYSIVGLDDGRFAFVIGDVSGRGLSAASTMAALRFTIRAYALDGDAPSTILEKCSDQLDIDTDGHFATVLIGLGDVARHEITLANAGHLNPLLIDGGRTSFVPTPVGVPIGVAGGHYRSVTVTVPPRATLIAFTDGLVERRHESLDAGLKRFEDAATGQDLELDALVEQIVGTLGNDGSEDDIAILAVRWTE
jgi:serine phosphatase RsbU (regulator of sigma subunit)